MNYFKIEFKRNIKRRSFILSFIIILIIMFINQILGGEYDGYRKSAILSSTIFSPSGIYYMIIPIMAGLAGSDLYGEDYRNKMYNNIIYRTEKKKYLYMKGIMSFTFGSLIFLLPLIIELLMLMLRYPINNFDFMHNQAPDIYGEIFDNIFYENLFGYWLIFLGLGIIYSGILSLVGFTVSLFIKNRYVILLSPLIFTFLLLVIGVIFKLEFISIEIVQPLDSKLSFNSIISYSIVVASMIFLIWRESKSEVY